MVEELIKQKLPHTSGFLDDGLLDSLLTIQLIDKLEFEFEISIPTSHFTHYNFNSLEAMENLVKELKDC